MPTGEKQPHPLSVGKISRREKVVRVIAGDGIYREKTYDGDCLVIRGSVGHPNYIETPQDVETKKGLSTYLNFITE